MYSYRGNRREVFREKGGPNILAKLTGKHLSRSLFFNGEFLRTSFLQNIPSEPLIESCEIMFETLL